VCCAAWIRYCHALALAGLLAMSLSTLAATPDAGDKPLVLPPAAGRLLVATPAMRGNYFRESVILLTAHGRMGSVGVILNRPTVLRLSDLLPRRGGSLTLFEGGPVHPHLLSLLVLVPEQGFHQVGNTAGLSFVFGTQQVLDRLPVLRHGWRYRVYSGYSGWAPGQLMSEIRRGAWYVVEGDSAQVFDIHPDLLWVRLMRRVFPLR